MSWRQRNKHLKRLFIKLLNSILIMTKTQSNLLKNIKSSKLISKNPKMNNFILQLFLSQSNNLKLQNKSKKLKKFPKRKKL